MLYVYNKKVYIFCREETETERETIPTLPPTTTSTTTSTTTTTTPRPTTTSTTTTTTTTTPRPTTTSSTTTTTTPKPYLPRRYPSYPRPAYRPRTTTSTTSTTETPRRPFNYPNYPRRPENPFTPTEVTVTDPRFPYVIEAERRFDGSYGINTSDIPKETWSVVTGKDKPEDDFDPNELHCLDGYERNDRGYCVGKS